LCEGGYAIPVLIILFSFIFDPGRCVPEYSSDSNASQKSKKKQAEVSHMFELSFKKCKRVQASLCQKWMPYCVSSINVYMSF
jgi:hypothetical protein